MQKLMTLICILLTAAFSPLKAGDTFIDYQNYDHGYCPECNCYPCQCNAMAEELGEEEGALPPPPCGPCGAAVPASAAFGTLPPPPPAAAAACEECEKPDPCDPAPVCATNCGISLCWIGLGIAVIATGAALIVSSNNGGHSH
jgi:hypothetical protein